MNDPRTITFIWQYMIFADQQIISAVQTMPEAGYHKEQGISLGSVEKLLDHVIAAQEAWLDRFSGLDLPFPAFIPAPLENTARRWGQVHQRLTDFAQSQTQQTLQKPVSGQTRLGVRFQLPTWACMLHLADHSTYHRGQLNSMIKLGGGKPSEVMLTRYAVDRAAI